MKDWFVASDIGKIKVHNDIPAFLSVEITHIHSKGAISPIDLLVVMNLTNLDATFGSSRWDGDFEDGTLCHDRHDASHGISKSCKDVGIVFDKVVATAGCGFRDCFEHLRVVIGSISKAKEGDGCSLTGKIDSSWHCRRTVARAGPSLHSFRRFLAEHVHDSLLLGWAAVCSLCHVHGSLCNVHGRSNVCSLLYNIHVVVHLRHGHKASNDVRTFGSLTLVQGSGDIRC
mmetsp:Transcript_46096/g.111688  ORF Transcript_46096/g.111688 Transcript_46096/m.111688 type:complete len:229 (-) Transcript_46096:723-1409(-)